MTLESYFLKEDKEIVYKFYQKLNLKSKPYNNITRQEMYNYVIKVYKENPEIIIEMVTIEELNILKSLIGSNLEKKNHGYLDYILFKSLLNNYLILDNGKEYYIPDDILNYIKMAINLSEEERDTFGDITASVAIGIVRAFNVLTFDEYYKMFCRLCFKKEQKELKIYLKNNYRVRQTLKIVKYKNEEYVVSTEYLCYKDVLKLKLKIDNKVYSLEELISIGKYRFNLFNEHLFNFLSYLEYHLEPYAINYFIEDLIIYSGFDVNDDEALKMICGNVQELIDETEGVLVYFPCWIYNGNTLDDLYKLSLNNKNN